MNDRINPSRFSQLNDLDRETQAQVLTTLASELEEYYRQVTALADGEDPAGARKLGHKVSGFAVHFGFDRLGAMAKEISGGAGQPDKLSPVLTELRELSSEIRSMAVSGIKL